METSQAVLNNMYFQGNVGKDNMGTIKTKDYIIDISRSEINKTFLQVQYEYRCTLTFKDLLGRVIKSVDFSEAQALAMIDSINSFVYNDYEELCLIDNINCPNNIYESYSFYLNKINDNGESIYLLRLVCYNSAINNVIPTIICRLSLDELDKLNDTMFFIFIIDLVSAREGIFQV